MTAVDNLLPPSVKSPGKDTHFLKCADSPVDSGHSKVWVQLAGLIINILAACPSAFQNNIQKHSSLLGYTLSPFLEFINHLLFFPHMVPSLRDSKRPKSVSSS